MAVLVFAIDRVPNGMWEGGEEKWPTQKVLTSRRIWTLTDYPAVGA